MADPLDGYLELRRRRQRYLLIGAGVAVLLVMLFAARAPLLRLLEGPAMPYAEDQRENFDHWMKDAWPHFVAEASWDTPERFETAAAAMLEASTFHPTLRRRANEVVEAMRTFDDYSRRWVALANRAGIESRMEEVSDAVASIDELLRTIDAPYCLDYQVKAQQEAGRWRLGMVARTARVYGVSTLRAGEREIEVLRTERLDTLGLRDLARGLVLGDRARVQVPTIRATIVNRYLPLLHSSAKLRDLFEEPRKGDVLGMQLRPALLALVPESLQPLVPGVAQLAVERREALEALNTTLERYRADLIPPEIFFMPASWYEEMESGLRIERHPEILAAIKRFTELGDVSAEQREAVAKVEAVLLEWFVRAVERHEAWHVLVPQAEAIDGAPVVPHGANETIAYLGAYADAEEDLLFVDDDLYRLLREYSDNERPTPTNLAVRLVAAQLSVQSLGNDDLPGMQELSRVDQIAAMGTARRARKKALARKLLREWFGEERSIAWVSHEPL